ncbi:MAG: ribosome assembly cofactor RimP [Bacteroidaceae bacterium]|nr:ribosome assembly cofactor RimP [Bacteroidaceae bacterium]
MISKSAVQKAVEEWLEGKEYFLVDINISPDDRIVVEIDHHDGVWIEDCADLSRHIESRLSRDEEDYELEVGSAGLGQPFRVHRQYEIHIGKEVETQLHDGHKYHGKLLSVGDESFQIGIVQKVKEEGKKRPVTKEVPTEFRFEDVAYTKYLIKVK